MERPNERKDTPESLEQSARKAMEAFRERRRRRRSDDTYFGSPEAVAGMTGRGAAAGEEERERRRAEILEDAGEDGMPPELAGLLYDIALEEGLNPALGYELVCTGLGVVPPEGGVSNAPDQPAVDKYLPTWIFPAEPTDQMLRERMLRTSFRRLRSLLEETGSPDEAFLRFASEPDVGHYGY